MLWWIFLVSLSILQGKKKPPFLIKVPPSLTGGREVWVEKNTYYAFLRLRKKILEESSIKIQLISGYRSYKDQEKIWQWKLKNLPSSSIHEILSFSAIPGFSRHHWGTEIDIGVEGIPHYEAITPEFFMTPLGKKLFSLLQKYAPLYGFCFPYLHPPSKRNPHLYTYGHEEEKWHLSYKKISTRFFYQMKGILSKISPKNLPQEEKLQKVYKEYFLNISSECLF